MEELQGVEHKPVASFATSLEQPEKQYRWCKVSSILAGAGVLVPDIPLEETGEIREAATKAGLELILLTTPTTPRERMQAIAKASQGFVYLVSVTGALKDRLQCS